MGKLRSYVGASDSFFLNNAVFRLQNALEAFKDPPAKAIFRYGTSRGRGYMHAWSGSNSTSMRVGDLTLHQRLVPEMADHIASTAPKGAPTGWRSY